MAWRSYQSKCENYWATRLAFDKNDNLLNGGGMAYLTFSTRGHELGKRALTTATVLGRAPDCDISVRDILLSRRHCALEFEGANWILVDLQSKNGTFVNGERVARHHLCDGESFTIGQTVVEFRGAQLGCQLDDSGVPLGGGRRPADPWEALEGTVSGFAFNETVVGRIDVQAVGRTSIRPLSQFPTPQPNPREPQGLVRDDLYSLLSEIASSSWDSIYSHASRHSPVRPRPRPAVHAQQHRVVRPPSPQQEQFRQAAEQILKRADKEIHRATRRHRWGKTVVKMLKGFAGVAQWVLLSGALLHAA